MRHEVAFRKRTNDANFAALSGIGQEIFRSSMRTVYRTDLQLGAVRAIAEDAGFEITSGVPDGRSETYLRNLRVAGCTR